MIGCHDMKLGEIYACGDCGLELQVVKECEDAGSADEDCACATSCGFECCGTPLTLKEN